MAWIRINESFQSESDFNYLEANLLQQNINVGNSSKFELRFSPCHYIFVISKSFAVSFGSFIGENLHKKKLSAFITFSVK